MPKFIPFVKGLNADFAFYCPGCKTHHGVWTTNKNGNQSIWNFNGDVDKPTVTPSILVRWVDYKMDDDGDPIPDTVKNMVCHSYVTDGKIQFLSDSTHELAGQTVELPEVD